MEVPTILGMPYLMFWGLISVILQITIQLRVKQCGENAYEKFIKGRVFTNNFKDLWVIFKFLYNPINWKDIQHNHIKVLLSINLIIVAYFLFEFFTLG
ncbi:hypothetical protein [Thalassotalea sp. Y01]|uniref:hypothetical protein n=1 Tax=Thalassotalea sp. Y01 TaxID=2729613 RepID=UPI00145DBCCF|nr:hypothetical protein [Thalassotalea sp. Y01]NMP15171.1 hypothetical protein [Thalassotalea sp. Y01]